MIGKCQIYLHKIALHNLISISGNHSLKELKLPITIDTFTFYTVAVAQFGLCLPWSIFSFNISTHSLEIMVLGDPVSTSQLAVTTNWYVDHLYMNLADFKTLLLINTAMFWNFCIHIFMCYFLHCNNFYTCYCNLHYSFWVMLSYP